MWNPLHIHLFEKYLAIFLYFRTLLLQVIKDHPIVNSFYVNLLSIFDIIKCFAFFNQFCKAYDWHAKVVFGAIKIDPSFFAYVATLRVK